MHAIQGFNTKLPFDIWLTHALQPANTGQVHMVVGGWECQFVSRADSEESLEDPGAPYFFDLVRYLNYLAQERQVYPRVYILENTFQ